MPQMYEYFLHGDQMVFMSTKTGGTAQSRVEGDGPKATWQLFLANPGALRRDDCDPQTLAAPHPTAEIHSRSSVPVPNHRFSTPERIARGILSSRFASPSTRLWSLHFWTRMATCSPAQPTDLPLNQLMRGGTPADGHQSRQPSWLHSRTSRHPARRHARPWRARASWCWRARRPCWSR